MKDDLTPKQERFVQNIVSGMTQRQAYKEAYDNNMTDEQVDVEACRLFNSPKINLRYREIMDKTEKKAIMSAQERMEWLTQVIMDIQREEMKVKLPDGDDEVVASKNADLNTKMKAMDILNKMSGEYVQKIEADVNNDVTINIELNDAE